MTLDLNPCGMRDKGCKLGICKASHRGPGGPSAPTARALVSSTAPAKASFSYSTWFLCLLRFVHWGFCCAFQAKQEALALFECPCFECQCSVCVCMHTCEGDEVHFKDVEAKYKFPTIKENEKCKFLPSGETLCVSRITAQVCRRPQQYLQVHPEVVRFLQC